MDIKCWKCQAVLDETTIKFRTICDKCQFYQHACVNCKHYFPGKPNDCAIPGTDPVRDRESFNFCESFTYKGPSSGSNYDDALDKAKKLFGD